MSYCDLSANARSAPKAQMPKQPALDDFERDIKANIEAIQSCARAAAAGQLDGSGSRLLPGQPSDSVSAAQHLSSGRALVAATERLFRDWAVQWAGEPAERCRKRCAHDRLQKALADAVGNLGDATRVAAMAQAETEKAASKEDLADVDGADEEATLLGSRPVDFEKDAAERRWRGPQLPSCLRNAAMRCRSWRESSASAAAGHASMKGRNLDLTDGDLPLLAGRLLVLQEAAYKLLVLVAVLLVLALGSRTRGSSGAAAASMAMRGAASTESFVLSAGGVVAWLDGSEDGSLPVLQDSYGNTTALYERKQSSRLGDITATDVDAAAAKRSIATTVSHESWGATQV